jgi:superoxide dismutase, Fe-Mn family
VDLRNLIDLVEAKGSKKLELKRLKYSRTALSPVLSNTALDRHLDLASAYVERYNDGEGDPNFNEAGAFLHNIFFAQLQAPKSNNRPAGPVLSLINRKYGDFGRFKEEFARQAMQLQGSNWVYLNKNGDIKTIKNHAIRNDIIMLIDWWEHAWFTDYGTNKRKYLDNMWRIINWGAVNSRL